ncbi:MAG: low molecular weight phosphotyrosine protein phosphatase [Clostridiales bacterium]|nr:MAG: low molecular weight phosphotyrosine protein phosphatase [Clostridiales bacterium]
MPWKHLPQRNGGIYDERRLEKAGDIRKTRYRLRRDVRARSGQPRLSRRAEKTERAQCPTYPHYSKQVRKTDYDKYDFFGMDDKNVAYLKNLFAPDEKKKVKKFLEYAGQSRDVADPYYTGNFDDTYYDLKIGIEFLINNIENRK